MRIEERVRTVIATHLNRPEASVGLASRLVEDLGLDSLETVGLTIALEDEFGIEVPDDAAAALLTVGDVVEFVRVTSG